MEKHLSEMTLSELIDEKGHDCSCGRHHKCDLKILKIGRGAVNALPESMKAIGVKRPFLVMDKNTQAAGKIVEGVLDKAGIAYTRFCFPMDGHIVPDEYAIGSLMMAFDPACDVLIAIGRGVINDCCKVAAHATGLPSMVVCTAPSMDGYASNSSAMIRNHVKVSLYNACPLVILADTDIVRTAPDVMLRAGLGDMLAKYIALCEWRISHVVYGDPYCEEIADLMRTSLRKIIAHADGLMKREDAAIEAVIEGLVLSGLAMAFNETSRPASGLEHYFSHLWEMQALETGKPYDLHGIQVGVGTLLTLWLYEKFLLHTEKPDAKKAREWMASFSQEKWLAQTERIFGAIAPEIIALEERIHKNDPAWHEKRLTLILEHWDEFRQVMREELPSYERIHTLMERCGLPLTPAELGQSAQETVDAFVGSRDIRDKYLTSTLLWDLGLMDEAAEALRVHCE